MFDLFLIAVGLVGFGLAAYYDLKTTEFSEMIPYGIIVLSIVAKLINSYFTGNFGLFFSSVASGILLLGIGLVLYYLGQWGDGDAFLLGALGFLLPIPTNIFNPTLIFPTIVSIVINTFAIGSAYTIVFSIFVAMTNPGILKHFVIDVKKNISQVLAATVFFFILLLAFPVVIASYFGIAIPIRVLASSLSFLPVLVFLVLLWRYAVVVDERLFTKKIHANKLRVGDVVKTLKFWRGVSEKDVREIRRKGGYVVVREGLRFAPVFFFSFLVTLVYGDAVLFLLGL